MVPIGGIFLLAGALAAVHVFAGKFRFHLVIPRSRWLSLSGGVSVAYVFVHLLPEITERQSQIAGGADTANVLPATSEHFLFIAALAGFAIFYGLEQLAYRSRHETDQQALVGGAETRTSAGVFWTHIASFAVYNALIGYLLLHREETGVWNLLLFVTAMALHFVVNDYGLREHHQEAYDRVGRWILAGAVFVGFVAGYLTEASELFLGLLLAFLAGGVILNVIKEELPEDRQSRFWAFGTGLTFYTLILLYV